MPATATATMKALAMKEYGDYKSVLSIQDLPTPQAKEGQIRIKVHAISLNPIDNYRIGGYIQNWLPEKGFPAIVCYDASGVVDQVGAGVQDFKVGDRVAVRSRTASGTSSQYLVDGAEFFAHVPEAVTFEQAAALPLAGLTAYQALLTEMKLVKGEKVLITAGSGGVGHLAIQIAKAHGATVYTTASGAGIELCKKLGADHVIDYRNEKFETTLKGIDVILDGTGECEKYPQVLNKGGRIIALATQKFPDHVTKAISEKGGWIRSWLMTPSGKDLTVLFGMIKKQQLKVTIDSVTEFADWKSAFDKLASKHAKGKLVIKMLQ